jgi:lysine-specific demethylase/histidyl-hydroxylase NO66
MLATQTAPTAAIPTAPTHSAERHWQVRRVPHPDSPGLADLIGDVAAFGADVLFRQPLLAQTTSIEQFGDVDVLWHDFLSRGTRRPAFRLVRTGTTIAARDVTRRAGIGNTDLDDLVSANAVVARYRGGDTVVLQGLHHTNPSLARLANNLALALDHPVQINAYLSPASARGLDLHFDFHDVFVVQLGGSKRWRAWAPLARTTNPVKGVQPIAAPRLDELGTPLLDVTLHAGDCLYLPRGYPHSAETVDQHSDHLTIGLVAVTWQRALRKAIDAEVAAGRLTGALPAGSLDPDAPSPASAADLEGLRAQLAPSVLRDWMAREIWLRQPATRLRPLVPPRLEQRGLAFTPGPLIWLTTAAGRAMLGLGDRLLDLPGEALGFLSGLLASEGPISPDGLDGLDDESRDVVLRRLLAEGVLTHVA